MLTATLGRAPSWCQTPAYELCRLCNETLHSLPRATTPRYGRAVPRNVRHEEPGAYYHVCSRGNDGRSIYIDEFDRWIFLELFTVVTRKHGWVVLSYCLMTNHYHVVLQIPD